MIRRFFAWLGFRTRQDQVSAIWLQQQRQDAHKGGVDQSSVNWTAMQQRPWKAVDRLPRV